MREGGWAAEGRVSEGRFHTKRDGVTLFLSTPSSADSPPLPSPPPSVPPVPPRCCRARAYQEVKEKVSDQKRKKESYEEKLQRKNALKSDIKRLEEEKCAMEQQVLACSSFVPERAFVFLINWLGW